VEASQLPPIVIKEGAKLLFTYFDRQSFASTTTIEEIPPGSRSWVRIVDLAAKPGGRLDQQLVYVADLRAKSKDGGFGYIVMSRRAFEIAAENRAKRPAASGAAASQPTTGDRDIVLYATSWCPACRKARSWLEAAGIPFVEKDIEKDSAAAAELLAKARQAGVSPSGVPVIDVRGTLIQGFDPARINALLGGKT
jgi:glutaredoxin